MSIADKLTAIAENVPKVFAAGKKSGYDEGFAAGKATGDYYDTFWDAYQQNGNRTDYNRAFSFFNDSTFRPKYDIRPTDGAYLFRNSQIADLKGILEDCGVVLDLSKCTNLTQAFFYSTVTRVPVIDHSGTTNCQIFTHAHDLVSVDKLILAHDTTFGNAFHTCTSLESIVIEGEIMHGIDFQWSTKLSKASIVSIINALSSTTSGLTVTLSRNAVLWAFTDYVPDPSSPFLPVFPEQEWTNAIASKPNWTFNLV